MEDKKITMQTYIEETPQTVLENLKNAKSLTKVLVEEFINNKYNSITIVASGSSFNSAKCSENFIKKILKIPVRIITPFTFVNYNDDILNDEMVIVISQSGYSTNIIESLKYIKRKNIKAIALTGNSDSDIKDYCDLLIDYGVGVELVGYVTKGVITLIEYLMLFTLESALCKKIITKVKYNYYFNEIKKAMNIHKDVQKKTWKFIEENFKKLTSMSVVYICGAYNGFNISLEGALKIGETIKIPAFAYEVEEYIHGPNLQLKPNYTVFFVDLNDNASKRIYDIYNATLKITDNSFMITCNKKIKGKNIVTLNKKIDSLIAPLCYLPFFEIIAFKITDDLNNWLQHPLLKKFKKIAESKTINYISYDEE